MENKELSKRLVQQQIGWVYPDFKWLTEKETILANRKRNELLKSLSNKINYSFIQNKLHIGKLSPGCLICGQGDWSCMFINGLCTRHCFYCPQDRKIKQERPPTEGVIFDNPEDYVDYLEKFNFKGVGFSGGETFLVFEKLLTYFKKIRKRFGKEVYLWIYTNGDLVDKGKLRKLKEAGLDEIRFNISARGYDLRPVELAINIIPTVTIEIPVIPEDYETVKQCLPKMQKMGVKYLNLHQLVATQHNYKNYIKRTYTFLHQPNIPIFESEMAALELIRYALDNQISLPINYCSGVYKDRLQGKGKRERIAPLVKEGIEEITNSGFLRSLSIQDSPTNLKKIIQFLKKRGHPGNLWSLNNTKTEIFIHGSLLKHLNFSKYNLIINYFLPLLKAGPHSNETGKEIRLNSNQKVFLKKELVAQQKGLSAIAIQSFRKLFIEKSNDREVLNYFYRNYNLKTKESLNEMKKEIGLLMALKMWEQLEAGFQEIY